MQIQEKMFMNIQIVDKEKLLEGQVYRHLCRYHWVCRELKRTMRVLDCGCGSGYGTQIISFKCENVIGIDGDKEAIEFAKRSYESDRLKFFNVDILSEWAEKNKESFDAIACLEVIEHIPDTDKFMQSIHKLLRKNGFVMISTPSKRKDIVNPHHVKEFGARDLVEKGYEYFQYVHTYNPYFLDIKPFKGQNFILAKFWGKK